MKKVNAVLSSLILSLPCLGMANPVLQAGASGRAASEPAGPLSAVATLVSVQETAEGRRARLLVHMVSNTTEADATIFLLDPDRRTVRGPALATVALSRGVKRAVPVETEVPGDGSQLLFRLTTRGRDGSTEEMELGYRIPRDDPDDCQVVGDYVQCMGEAMTQVQP